MSYRIIESTTGRDLSAEVNELNRRRLLPRDPEDPVPGNPTFTFKDRKITVFTAGSLIQESISGETHRDTREPEDPVPDNPILLFKGRKITIATPRLVIQESISGETHKDNRVFLGREVEKIRGDKGEQVFRWEPERSKPRVVFEAVKALGLSIVKGNNS